MTGAAEKLPALVYFAVPGLDEQLPLSTETDKQLAWNKHGDENNAKDNDRAAARFE
jgi:hypothetical protein